MLICDRLIEFSSQKIFSSNLYKLFFFKDDEGNQDEFFICDYWQKFWYYLSILSRIIKSEKHKARREKFVYSNR
ncbi:hypothetical protein GXM_08466 [Nostoc sphaeroides CCNUC1]|uniref:Uncharacterized protein n=1 Tax=Nostoc sphaeroides CCNUC1 TaxID=2653204 RepID=A0A5P8WEL5_9NOSO|nr:hypothetical protein GXM_08466 [Nostoc sphaeroides CCNUC1]